MISMPLLKISTGNSYQLLKDSGMTNQLSSKKMYIFYKM